MQIDDDLIALYVRFAKLQKQLTRISAEIDNVRESIRAKEM